MADDTATPEDAPAAAAAQKTRPPLRKAEPEPFLSPALVILGGGAGGAVILVAFLFAVAGWTQNVATARELAEPGDNVPSVSE